VAAGSDTKADLQKEVNKAFKKYKKDHVNTVKEQKNLALLYENVCVIWKVYIFTDQASSLGLEYFWTGLGIP
jgi:hypothetical protein